MAHHSYQVYKLPNMYMFMSQSNINKFIQLPQQLDMQAIL